MPHPATMDTKVQIGFGYTPYSTSVTWTDISDDVHVRSGGTTMVAKTGRSGTSGITPGSLSLTLENRDGKFNPRNTAGPYYGNLKLGVPIRVVCTVDSIPITRWQGFVSSGWPQDLTQFAQTVQLQAHDLFGFMAQSPALDSAWKSAVAVMSPQPNHWWRPGIGGWFDYKGASRGRHSGGFNEFDGVTVGEPKSLGQNQPDGYGTIPDGNGFVDVTATGNIQLISFWFRSVPAAQRQLDPATGYDDTHILSEQYTTTGGTGVPGLTITSCVDNTSPGLPVSYIRLEYSNQTGSVTWSTPFPNLIADGAAHHVQIRIRGYTSMLYPTFWIDGVQILGGIGAPVPTAHPSPPTTWARSAMTIGWKPGTTQIPYQGVIDHILMWDNHTGTVAQLDALAAAQYQAGIKGWANQRLDQRVTNIVTSLGLSHYLGTIDASGVITQQSYVGGDVIGLLQQIEDTEQGRIWIDQGGALNFSKRSWAWDDSISNTLQFTFSDVGTTIDAGTGIEMLQGGTVIIDDPLKITNVATVTSTYGYPQPAESASSIAQYGRRNPVSLSGLLHSSDRQSQQIAEWLVYSRSTPNVQLERVTFDVDVQYTASKYAAVLGRPGALTRVTKTPPIDSTGTPIGPTVTVDAHITGVTHTWSWVGLVVMFDLDASRVGKSWFKWGTSTWNGSSGWAF